jgi:hypothetical protein
MYIIRVLQVTCVFLLGALHSYDYEVAIATMFHDEAPYLREWIEYHKMIGVDHFWLYNDRSTDNFEAVLAPYIQEGSVELIEWPIILQDHLSNAYTGTQTHIFRNALRRAQGVAKWLACVDIDEAILPLSGRSLPECLRLHFEEAGAVYANWCCLGTGGISVPLGQPIFFKLIASSLANHSRNCVGKSIYRPEAVRIDELWYAHAAPLKEGYRYLNGDGYDLPPIEGKSVRTDGLTHTKYIRINHYVMRDENYFQDVRIARAKNGFNGHSIADIEMLNNHNYEFSLVKDYALIRFIKKNYPEKVVFWEEE